MKQPRRYQIDPRKILVRKDRDLPLNEDAAGMICQSLVETGEMRDDIHVRKTKAGPELIDGLHRRSASIRAEWDLVWVKEWECTLEQARLMQSDANVTFSHMSPLDLAVGLARREQAYRKLHPETQQGVAGALARHDVQRTFMSFAEMMGQLVGRSPRQIRRIVQAGAAVNSEQVRLLRSAAKQATMNDLIALGQIEDLDQRDAVCVAVSEGEATSIGDAIKRLKPAAKPALSADDKAFNDLRDKWTRAPMAAKRRFVSEYRREVGDLMDDILTGDLRSHVEGDDA